jgi:phosphoribosylformimino-5-aminoimidazole carboxamide ribotide isomerase
VKVYADDPVEVVAEFARAGAQRVHVVDLDGARGSGSNRDVVAAMLKQHDIKVQVAGGVRSVEAVDALLAGGATWVVMGTAAVQDARLFERCVTRHPDRILAALDIRDDKPAVAGWTGSAPVMIGSLVGRWDSLRLAGIIVTAIDRDGTLSGPDLVTLARIRRMTRLDLQYSGGVSSTEQIRQVAEAGAQAVILGKALYEGRITLEQALAT